ncbi:maternal protein pumilio-like [Impatiens glandulifera]|uniref:maternal protein pumilio-like n=1 Tax=Impatiens glandulifera TaxID=253017 RepID=UPI001FB0B073|nr:maternal protein pumilio-like [Impatiens glandulifera]
MVAAIPPYNFHHRSNNNNSIDMNLPRDIATVAEDPTQSQSLQDLLEMSPLATSQIMIERLSDNIHNLMNLPRDIATVAEDPTQSQSLQDLLEMSPLATSQIMIERLSDNIHNLMNLPRDIATVAEDPTQSQSLQDLLEMSPLATSQIMIERLSDNIHNLMITQHGQSLFFKLIENCNPNQLNQIVTNLGQMIPNVALEIYGNFVMQTTVQFLGMEVGEYVCARLKGQYVALSITKNGSHLVEKCIRYNPRGIFYLVEDLLEDPKTLMKVAQQEFGNFVVQSALELTQNQPENEVEDLHMRLYATLEYEFSQAINITKYGLYVTKCMKKITRVFI